MEQESSNSVSKGLAEAEYLKPKASSDSAK